LNHIAEECIQKSKKLQERVTTKTAPTSDRSAGVPPAVAGASRHASATSTSETAAVCRTGKLPQQLTSSRSVSKTLPRTVLDRIESEKKNILRTAAELGRDISPDERKSLTRLSTARIEQFLDSGRGACHLQVPAIAEIVSESLRHFDEKRYRLFAWCIMPNHVHVVVRLFPGNSLAQILHSWKSFSAKQAEKVLRLNGPFWQRASRPRYSYRTTRTVISSAGSPPAIA